MLFNGSKCATRSAFRFIRSRVRFASTIPKESSLRLKWGSYVLAVSAGIFSPILFYHTEDYWDQARQVSVPLEKTIFTPFILSAKEPVSSTSSIFTLDPIIEQKGHPSKYLEAWKQGLWSVQIKQPQLQIARAYTPLPPSLHVSPSTQLPYGQLRFLVRHDPKGEVSSYLHKLPLGAHVDLRGPHLEFTIPENTCPMEVLFLAGGTGIAPALQMAHSLFGAHSDRHIDRANLHILWANRKSEDCLGGTSDFSKAPQSYWKWPDSMWSKVSTSPVVDTASNALVQELNTLAQVYDGHIKTDYYVDERGTFITEGVLKKAVLGKGVAHRQPESRPLKLENKSSSDSSAGGQAMLPPTIHEPIAQKLILVSGPDGFVENLAGKKSWKGGQEIQGELRGILGKLDLQGWTVWKL
ncbi:mitochondrial peripheral inner membrane protein [Bachmanniomyces sp. S44760]|nr:mitochondrial peripheral inner membrane protein [Bachmanniomyces sp. S44760]